MNTNLAMGLRGDEAREILKNNGYAEKEYAYSGLGSNDALWSLYGITAIIGGFVGHSIGGVIECSAEWIKNHSCEPTSPMTSIAAGGILGLILPIYLLSKVDRKEITEAERINEVRKQAMAIIDNNYWNVRFHSPLKGSHLRELLKLVDQNTQNQLIDRLNEVQALKVLKNRSINPINNANLLSKCRGKKKWSKPSGCESQGKDEWKKAVQSEEKAWRNLETALLKSNEKEIVEAYTACKDAFGEDLAEMFTTAFIKPENLKLVYKLSDRLATSSKRYYLNHKDELDLDKYFN